MKDLAVFLHDFCAFVISVVSLYVIRVYSVFVVLQQILNSCRNGNADLADHLALSRAEYHELRKMHMQYLETSSARIQRLEEECTIRETEREALLEDLRAQKAVSVVSHSCTHVDRNEQRSERRFVSHGTEHHATCVQKKETLMCIQLGETRALHQLIHNRCMS